MYNNTTTKKKRNNRLERRITHSKYDKNNTDVFTRYIINME